MTKASIFSILFMLCGASFARQVKFSVDMTGQTISANGVHISGDFQTEAGFPTDWDSKSTIMNKETGTEIYSVVVTIPAFRKYEYKFVNGDLFYEVEFVPVQSRVGYDFNDNRWFYLDSLDNGITILPPLMFGGNAPSGQKMVRFRLDMQSQASIDNKGVHVSGSFAAWDNNRCYMYSFADKVYEYMAYVNPASYEYKFLNGNSQDKFEAVSGACVNGSNNRTIAISSDTVLDEVCFGQCTDCSPSSVPADEISDVTTLYPNPCNENTVLKISHHQGIYSVALNDFLGRQVASYTKMTAGELQMNTGELKPGIYLVIISNTEGFYSTLKLMKE